MDRYELYPQDTEELCRSLGIERSLSMAERDKIDDSDFAWPDAPDHPKYPINSQAHLDAAAKLIGRAPEAEQAAIKKRAMAIAKRKGYSLPDSWQEDEKSDESKSETQDRSITTEGMPPAVSVGASPESFAMSMPLVRIDATKRMVWGQATAEVPDSYGTIFGYYPDAWKQWRGNIREQHDPKKAVGKRVDLECNDLERKIYVGSRISRGAQDTWMKVEDDVLAGYSASIIPDKEFGNNPATWPRKEYNGKQYPYLPRYSVAELSLVDNPACPGCDIQIVRADGFATDVLDLSEPEPEPVPETIPLDRAGATISAATKDKMHGSIKHTIHAAVSQMQNCGCDNCMVAQKMIDPDGDGDIDMGGYDDPDGDAAQLYAQGNSTDDMERTIIGIVERALHPVYARLQGIAGTLSRSNTATSKPLDYETMFEPLITGAITRAVDAANAANASSLTEVRADLSAVKEQVDAIANTPLPGAPILNTSAIPRPSTPVDKRLPTDSYDIPRHSGSAVADAVAAMSAAGQLDTTQKQVDAMAAALAAQRRR